jgi:hypothetical protein
MHYNAAENPNGHKSSEINPFEMIQLVKHYNTAPHSAFYGLGPKPEEYNGPRRIQPNNPFEAQPLENKRLTNISPAGVCLVDLIQTEQWQY